MLQKVDRFSHQVSGGVRGGCPDCECCRCRRRGVRTLGCGQGEVEDGVACGDGDEVIMEVMAGDARLQEVGVSELLDAADYVEQASALCIHGSVHLVDHPGCL